MCAFRGYQETGAVDCVPGSELGQALGVRKLTPPLNTSAAVNGEPLGALATDTTLAPTPRTTIWLVEMSDLSTSW